MNKLYKLISLTVLTIALSPALLLGQTTHEVNVSNIANGGFTPSQLNIVEGDIVRWTNTEGFHSVDGSSDEFPDNPEAFGNESGSAGWVYEHTFTMVGEYDYWCGIHTGGMLGSISVSTATSVGDIERVELINVFPNPAVNALNWTVNDGISTQNALLTLYSITGKKVAEVRLAAQTSLDVSQFESGTYFFQIQDGDSVLQTGKILVVTN